MALATKIFLIFLCLNIFTHSFSKTTCIKSERQALLKFKEDLKNTSNMLPDWSSDGDCCNWDRIVCDKVTGHVTELDLRGSNVKPKFGGKLNPALLELKQLSYLDLSNNDFDQNLTSAWFWNLTSHLHYLNISRNKFWGNIPDLLITTSDASVVLDFSSNNFTGPIPLISYNVVALHLSDNSMSGTVSNFLCYKAIQPMKLKDPSLKNNLLEVLNLESNLLTGEIPNCWKNWPTLVGINLSNNSFNGTIPPSMGNLSSLKSLHLRNNRLVGDVPSLSNCTELLTIDFGGNHLSGEIPSWIGENFTKLTIISLRKNKFHGPVPEELCAISSLRNLDLSVNNLSGSIPRCIGNLAAMATRNESDGKIAYSTSMEAIFENIELVTKGSILDFSSIVKILKVVDLSSNNLSGEIPVELTSLVGLISLNLSNNRLVGRIPDKIGAMSSLESVDLSRNNLSDEIPRRMLELSFLCCLNLSYNNLTGKIPSGRQFATFDASSYLGNHGLYGPPLNGSRNNKVVTHSAANNLDKKLAKQVNWLYLNVELGFFFGFLGIALPLLFSKSYVFRKAG